MRDRLAGDKRYFLPNFAMTNERRQEIFAKIRQQVMRSSRKTARGCLLIVKTCVRAARVLARFVVLEPTIIIRRQPSALVLKSRRVGLVVADGLLILVSTLVVVVFLI